MTCTRLFLDINCPNIDGFCIWKVLQKPGNGTNLRANIGEQSVVTTLYLRKLSFLRRKELTPKKRLDFFLSSLVFQALHRFEKERGREGGLSSSLLPAEEGERVRDKPDLSSYIFVGCIDLTLDLRQSNLFRAASGRAPSPNRGPD